ncbi:hypothetical protein JST97_28035 [bacterium]|nr:hypothetical protein [bacterium]
MSTQTRGEELQLRQQRASHVFQEMLTATSPDVRQALEALYELMQAEMQLCQCHCQNHVAQKAD